jgi:oligoribonuclease NrnB/cAMP/cGMP phosphodiesterase (DHH superfamily)
MERNILIYVLYHAGCRDGFAAAYAARKHFGDTDYVEYIPVQYDNPPPVMHNDSEVYIVDFAYPREEILALRKRMHRVVVIDHHKTHQEELEGLDDVIFDMDKSGCILTWEYFHPNDFPSSWMMNIQDRDLWLWDVQDTDEVTSGMELYPFDFEVWDNFDIRKLKQEGSVIIKVRNNFIHSVTRNPIWKNIYGHRVPCVNTGQYVSKVAHKLCDIYPKADFAACYFDIPGKRVWSLRSVGEFDVSAVAKRCGGGGHLNAAGFTENLPG